MRRPTARRVNIKIRNKKERTNSEEKLEKNKESHFVFFEVNFFWTETKRLRQKNQDIFQKRNWKQKNAKCFWEIMHEKNQKQKDDETQEKQGFFSPKTW